MIAFSIKHENIAFNLTILLGIFISIIVCTVILYFFPFDLVTLPQIESLHSFKSVNCILATLPPILFKVSFIFRNFDLVVFSSH